MVYRYADQARGEIRRPLAVVPRLEYRVSPEIVVWPRGGKAPEIAIDLVSHLGASLAGELSFAADCGERPTVSTPFRLEARGKLSLRVPGAGLSGERQGADSLVLAAAAGDERALAGAPTLDYPHVPPAPLRGNDGFDLVRAEIQLPDLSRVGYVLGASDKVPELLAEIGVPIQILSAADLEKGDLARFDAIVVGSRAYETETAPCRRRTVACSTTCAPADSRSFSISSIRSSTASSRRTRSRSRVRTGGSPTRRRR